jgi:hypothetical protein
MRKRSEFSSQVHQLRRTVKLDTQKIRAKLVTQLQTIFDYAMARAREKRAEESSRQAWARVATYVAQVINDISKRFDERQIDDELGEVERLLNEARGLVEMNKSMSEQEPGKPGPE